MRVTIRQVAEKAGVSKTTVSKVLVGRHDGIPEQTRERILHTVREMGYVPIRTALQNRHMATRAIAYPIDDVTKIQSTSFTQTYSGICEGAVSHGYDVLCLVRKDSNWVDTRKELRFLDRRSDGVIFDLSVLHDTSGHLVELARHKVPTVVCYSRDVPRGIGWVDPDNKGAMYGAVHHLLSKGHRCISFVALDEWPGWATYFDKGERLKYFQEAVRHHGLAERADLIFPVGYSCFPADLPLRMLQSGVTAAVCVNDGFAIALIRAARAAGISVPGELSVVGVDNYEAEKWDLTSMGFSFREIGLRAVDALAGLVEGKPVEEGQTIVPVQLYERGSVRDLRRK